MTRRDAEPGYDASRAGSSVSGATSASIAALVRDLEPFDELETEYRADALGWLHSTVDVFRRVPPKTPSKHLVAYFVLQDPADGSVLLVEHRKAGLWLPTGVEVGEDPADTVRRESIEELGLPAVFADPKGQPVFVTVTETVGAADARHVDVSLWYLLVGSREVPLRPDPQEFASVRWWSPSDLRSADLRLMEPHLGRFLAKVAAAS